MASLILHNISTFWETHPVHDEVREAHTDPFCLEPPFPGPTFSAQRFHPGTVARRTFLHLIRSFLSPSPSTTQCHKPYGKCGWQNNGSQRCPCPGPWNLWICWYMAKAELRLLTLALAGLAKWLQRRPEELRVSGWILVKPGLQI